MDDFLKTIGALNDETRIKILYFIDKYEKVCVCDIEKSFDMIQSRISRHLKILKDAGFLRVEREGRWAYYSIRSPLDRFRLQAIDEIKHLGITLPDLQNRCDIKKKGY